jgi:hypothetical protein
MRLTFAVLTTLLLLLVPARLFAKADTVKITIKGADLKTPIEITDPKVLKSFFVWGGPGRSSIQPGSFIIDWSQGPAAEPPKGLPRYEVSFYAKMPNERIIYVVFYERDPSMEQGYVYLPGSTDEWYPLNTRAIYRGTEGNWFRAWSVWDKVARPLIAGAKMEAANAGRGQSLR